MSKIKNRITPVRIVAVAFLCVIFLGATLLTRPFSSAIGQTTNFIDALFTATSATCVTGLVVVDTFSYWSLTGKCIILTLIQIGGLGAMTLITALAVFIKKRISLRDSLMLMQSAGAFQLSGLLKLIKRIFLGTIVFETAGSIVLATQMVPLFGWKWGIFSSIFHSVSAFCNAGFDVMGNYNGGASLSAFVSNPVVNITIAFLIVVGGLGFVVWSDIVTCKFRISKLQFHSKLVLTVTAALILVGGGLFLLFEGNHAFSGLTTAEKMIAALFQSVTPRTAGFATVNQATLTESGSLLTIMLMFIGGSPGSTAGGIKTTTFAVVVISVLASARKANETKVFKRRIDEQTVRQATSVMTIYMAAILVSVMVIGIFEVYPLKDIMFEVVSAIATVGLTTGITPHIHNVTRVILTALMFMGRVGGLSFALALAENRNQAPVSHPAGKVLIG